MTPDPARSRVEWGTRLVGRRDGFSLLELMFVVAMIATLAGIAVPMVTRAIDDLRPIGAARYLAAQLNLARMEAVKRSRYVALRIEAKDGGYCYRFYADGNRNGVRVKEIDASVDEPLGPSERLDDKFPGVVFGILPGVSAIESSEPLEAGGDPVRFGHSDLLSFSPMGSATAGTVYIHGRRRQQTAVRVLGVTGRVRVLRFDFQTHQWMTR